LAGRFGRLNTIRRQAKVVYPFAKVAKDVWLNAKVAKVRRLKGGCASCRLEALGKIRDYPPNWCYKVFYGKYWEVLDPGE
jgi:hypothetical protein